VAKAGSVLAGDTVVRNVERPGKAIQSFKKQWQVDRLLQESFGGRGQWMREAFGVCTRDDQAQPRMDLGQALDGAPVILRVTAQAQHGNVDGLLLNLPKRIAAVECGYYSVVGLHQCALQGVACRHVVVDQQDIFVSGHIRFGCSGRRLSRAQRSQTRRKHRLYQLEN
jgi:hypothetical protein